MSNAEGKENWNVESTRIQVLNPGTVAYQMASKEAAVRGFNRQPATALYDAIALRYNECTPGQIILLDLPNRPTASNMRKYLRVRGLDEDDYLLFRPVFDGQGRRYPSDKTPLGLQRISGKDMRTLQPYPMEAARILRAAEEKSAVANAALEGIVHGGTPVNPGPADQFPAGNTDVTNT